MAATNEPPPNESGTRPMDAYSTEVGRLRPLWCYSYQEALAPPLTAAATRFAMAVIILCIARYL
jgi:hypothetical protein